MGTEVKIPVGTKVPNIVDNREVEVMEPCEGTAGIWLCYTCSDCVDDDKKTEHIRNKDGEHHMAWSCFACNNTERR